MFGSGVVALSQLTKGEEDKCRSRSSCCETVAVLRSGR